ncbi:MAG: hypothetical protein RBS86_04850 [Candidatus Moranbacteria bacterium]|nr:hypothetical protein [Candidatus Moranbacteria bacterium]
MTKIEIVKDEYARLYYDNFDTELIRLDTDEYKIIKSLFDFISIRRAKVNRYIFDTFDIGAIVDFSIAGKKYKAKILKILKS